MKMNIDLTSDIKLFLMAVLLLTRETFVSSCEKEELILVQMITSRGSVSPSVTYLKDPNPEEVWVEGLDDLTMLGKFQPYALGYFLKGLYENFITSNPTEIDVISGSNKDSVKSAQALVTALYAPNSNWEIVKNFPYQPIYIHYGLDTDKYLLEHECPAADLEYQRILNEETNDIYPTYENLIDSWQVQSGWTFESLADIESLFNTVKTEAIYNLTIPDWVHDTWEHMKYIHDIAFSLKLKTDLLKRLRGGPFVDVTLNTMKRKISGELNKTKVFVYSTHGFNVAAFLSAMGMWNNQEPEACATILVELYLHDKDHFVRYLFLNSSTPERMPQQLYTLIVPGCTEFCSLEYVLEFSKKMIPENLEKECQL